MEPTTYPTHDTHDNSELSYPILTLNLLWPQLISIKFLF